MAKEKHVKELAAELETPDNVANIAELENIIADKDAEIALLQRENDQLKNKPASAAEPVTFEYDGRTYEVKNGTSIPSINQGKALTALEIANSTEAQEWLVTKQSGHIREVK